MHRPPATVSIPLLTAEHTSDQCAGDHEPITALEFAEAVHGAGIGTGQSQYPEHPEGSSLLHLGTTAQQAIAVPDRAHANQAEWLTGSPTPG